MGSHFSPLQSLSVMLCGVFNALCGFKALLHFLIAVFFIHRDHPP
jgi:hypothetical protein